MFHSSWYTRVLSCGPSNSHNRSCIFLKEVLGIFGEVEVLRLPLLQLLHGPTEVLHASAEQNLSGQSVQQALVASF